MGGGRREVRVLLAGGASQCGW